MNTFLATRSNTLDKFTTNEEAYKNASTFRHVKLENPLRRFVTFFFSNEEKAHITDLYNKEEDNLIDCQSIQNDFDITLKDLSEILKKHS